jgi:nitroreductase
VQAPCRFSRSACQLVSHKIDTRKINCLWRAQIAATFRAKYPDARPEHVEAERERLVRVPLVIAVVSRAGPHVKILEWEQVLSAGAAAMSLVLAAHALGYGANWITEWYAYDRGVLDALGLAQRERRRLHSHRQAAGSP